MRHFRYAFATLLLAITFGVSALNVEIGIRHDLTREDGSPLAAADIATTTLYAGSAVLITQNGLASRVVVDLPTCSASHLTGTVTDKDGLESARSAILTVELCRPSAPELSGVRVPPGAP